MQPVLVILQPIVDNYCKKQKKYLILLIKKRDKCKLLPGLQRARDETQAMFCARSFADDERRDVSLPCV
jgi:hypothetical protein